MATVWRIVLAVSIGVVVLTGFLCGVDQYPDRAQAPFLAVVVGLGSAFCWGCTAIEFGTRTYLGLAGKTGLLNLFAAVFAAMAVGYLIPGEACQLPAQASGFHRFVCGFYSNP